MYIYVYLAALDVKLYAKETTKLTNKAVIWNFCVLIFFKSQSSIQSANSIFRHISEDGIPYFFLTQNILSSDASCTIQPAQRRRRHPLQCCWGVFFLYYGSH